MDKRSVLRSYGTYLRTFLIISLPLGFVVATLTIGGVYRAIGRLRHLLLGLIEPRINGSANRVRLRVESQGARVHGGPLAGQPVGEIAAKGRYRIRKRKTPAGVWHPTPDPANNTLVWDGLSGGESAAGPGHLDQVRRIAANSHVQSASILRVGRSLSFTRRPRLGGRSIGRHLSLLEGVPRATRGEFERLSLEFVG